MLPEVPSPDEAELGFLVLTAPLMPGAEYLTADTLRGLWHALEAALAADLAASGAKLQEKLKQLNPAWNLVGRVHFNLAENRGDAEAPFAFLATYTSQLSAQARRNTCRSARRCASTPARQEPAAAALAAAAGAARRRAVRWLRAMVDRGEIYPPAALDCRARRGAFWPTCAELEPPASSCACRRHGRLAVPPRPRVKATVGAQAPSCSASDALLDFQHRGHARRRAPDRRRDQRAARPAATACSSCAGAGWRWIASGCGSMLERFRAIEPAAAERGLPFAEAMRLLAGAWLDRGRARGRRSDWSQRGRRAMAGRDAARAAPARGPGAHRSGRSAARRRCARTSRSACAGCTSSRARAGRVPRRRHGARQDDPGAALAAGPEARGRTVTPEPPACWSRRPRCWPTGPRRSRASRPDLRVLHRASLGNVRADELKRFDARAARAASTW